MSLKGRRRLFVLVREALVRNETQPPLEANQLCKDLKYNP